MAYQKLQAGMALVVIPSNNINIPSPSDAILSTTGAITLTNTLAGTGTTFEDGSIKVGDIIYHEGGAGQALRITAIVSGISLTVDDGAGGAVLNSAGGYTIYKDRNQACVLYVGVAGVLEVVMSNGQFASRVEFQAAANGYHPIQVKRVCSGRTTATDIIALW